MKECGGEDVRMTKGGREEEERRKKGQTRGIEEEKLLQTGG